MEPERTPDPGFDCHHLPPARAPSPALGALGARPPAAHSGPGFGPGSVRRAQAARPQRVRSRTASPRVARSRCRVACLPRTARPVPWSGDADAAAGPGGRRRCRCWLSSDCMLPPLRQLLLLLLPVTRPLPFLSSLFASVLFLRLCARADCTVCFGRSSLGCARVCECACLESARTLLALGESKKRKNRSGGGGAEPGAAQ